MTKSLFLIFKSKIKKTIYNRLQKIKQRNRNGLDIVIIDRRHNKLNKEIKIFY